VLRAAADLLSGPGGLAAWLRTSQLDGAIASVSLSLDIGAERPCARPLRSKW
jgi:hypothetical protein